MAFVPLHVLSSYSLLTSPTKIAELVKTAKDRGYSAMALTDNNTMYGAIEFYQACLKNDLKPLVGLTIWLDSTRGIDNQFALVLLAKNLNGYHNLLRISSARMTGGAAKATLTFDDLRKYWQDLVVIVPPVRSEVNELLERGMANDAQSLIEEYQQVITPENLFLGINGQQTHVMRQTLTQMAQKAGIGCLPLPRVEYLNEEDHFATQVLRDIESGKVLQHPELLANGGGNNWLKPPTEFVREYTPMVDAKVFEQLDKVVVEINLEIPIVNPRLPQFATPNHQDSITYLTQLCQRALEPLKKTLQDGERYQARLDHELAVIKEMGFADYFLIIHDVVQFAHQNQILTGPGRGSAAGSLVAYLLKITSVDPLQYGLLFERFLNPERAQMPDIDLDIPDDQREVVLQYVHDRYGHQHVGQIITFGTLAAKQAIRDVARVFGEMPNKINQISALIPNKLNITLKQAAQTSHRLRDFIESSPKNRFMFETACRLEGLPRHFSTHAAGIVLSQDELVESVPVQDGNEGMLMSQYSKNFVEQVGLLKMDFLGLRNLSLMNNILQLVRRTEPKFEIEQIDLNDPQTLQLFQRGDTSGVFQFESAGIRNVLRKVHPTNFGLVVAVNALYRPGPMENIDRFVKRKDHLEPYHFPNQVLERVLGETYGILVYQEQVMEVASAMGGLSLGQADLLRRAMSKKKHAVIEQMRTNFIQGALQKGYSEKIAQQVYRYIENFANYGFNKSHAVAYSKLAFQLAYLKAHYPGDFYTALLNSVVGNDAKTKTYIQELKRLGIPTLAPDINQSSATYTYQGGQIRMGFTAIKGLRRDFIQHLLAERERGGRFKTVDDWLRRMGDQGIDEDVIDKLIFAGALDSFGYNRAELDEYLPELLKGITFSGQNVDLFQKLMPTIKSRPDLPLDEKLDREEELLGTYVSAHPVERFAALIKQRHFVPIQHFKAGEKVTSIVYIRSIRTIRTKKGEPMAFAKISDQTDECEAVIFPRVFQASQLLESKRVLQLTGKVEQREDQLQLIVDQIAAPQQRSHRQTHWVIKVPSRKNPADFQRRLFGMFKEYHGQVPVTLVYQDTNQQRALSEKFSLQGTPEVKKAFENLLGLDQISLVEK
ncbi:DNA polymerase III subunit alpha [Pediococcus acidilactici]